MKPDSGFAVPRVTNVHVKKDVTLEHAYISPFEAPWLL